MQFQDMLWSQDVCNFFSNVQILWRSVYFLWKAITKNKKQFKIRVYAKGDYNWKQEERWFKRFPKVNVDRGESSLENAISNSRLVITNYNGSTYQETLSANIPTIIFWDMSLSEIFFSKKWFQ